MPSERISWVNGRFVPHLDAVISIDDRSIQFGDSVYEIVLIYNGSFISLDSHMVRLRNSLNLVDIHIRSDFDIVAVMSEVVKRNNIENGSINVQISRGIAEREHHIPCQIEPSIIITTKNVDIKSTLETISVMTCDDIRWKLRNVKTNSLMGNTMILSRAKGLGYDDAIMIESGNVTEAVSSNIFVVKNGVLITPIADWRILRGTVRGTVIQLASEKNIKFLERNVSLSELYDADEIFTTSSVALIRSVTSVDRKVVGEGNIGELTLKLHSAYFRFLDHGDHQ